MKQLKKFIGKQVKDFVLTPIKNEMIIVFEDNTALWFKEKPYAYGSVKQIGRGE